jgi:ABC-type Zn2+ transport system substrate-binding protein/surface adhesin
MQTLAQIQPTTTEKSPKNGAVSPKKTNRIQPLDNRTDVSSSINHNKNHHHHHRRHHHHHHRHHHHHNKDSPSSQSTNSSHEYHRGRTFDHHHRDPSVSFPRIVTPQLPKIITPSLSKMSTAIYRETGSNTGNETKLTRDSSVTADLADIPSNFEYFNSLK